MCITLEDFSFDREAPGMMFKERFLLMHSQCRLTDTLALQGPCQCCRAIQVSPGLVFSSPYM